MADSFDHIGDSSFEMGSGLDCGVLGKAIDVTPPKSWGARPVKNDDGALVAIVFGQDDDLDGDIEDIAEALSDYQRTGTVMKGYTAERLSRMSLCWVDVPAVVPVADGRTLPADNRMSSSYYKGLPSLENVKGLFFSSSANINWLLDEGLSLDSEEAQGRGLYVPLSTCPRGV
jgi:hypothetical protein